MVIGNFCLDETGFIYPIFDETICDNKNDETINKKEFSHIIEFEKKLRISELKKFRKLEKKLVEESKQKKEIEEKKNLGWNFFLQLEKI